MDIGMLTSKRKNDCAIVALSAFFKLEPEVIELEIGQICGELGLNWRVDKGTPNLAWQKFAERRGLKANPVPRRGQDKMTGLICLRSGAGSRSGHMVCVISGLVFDAFVKGMPIAQYRATHVRGQVFCYWSR